MYVSTTSRENVQFYLHSSNPNSSLVRITAQDEIGGISSASMFKFEQENSCLGDNGCDFLLIADPDTKSKNPDGKSFSTSLMKGTLQTEGHNNYHVDWKSLQTITGLYNEGGRGMELSDLVFWNKALYTFDDRSGIAYEILPNVDNTYFLIPRYILSEGDGYSSEKGMKIEWATVKDGSMWVGSFGKEYTDNMGNTKHHWTEWVVAIDKDQHVYRKNWIPIFNSLRALTNSEHPGYMIHEAIEWSPVHRKWFILPRRVSSEQYDVELDASRGSNTLIICNESFIDCSVTKIGEGIIDPKRGYSAFAFVPGTKDQLIFALLTMEEDQVFNTAAQKTYYHIFDINGVEVTPQTLISVEGKFEGVAFVNTVKRNG